MRALKQTVDPATMEAISKPPAIHQFKTLHPRELHPPPNFTKNKQWVDPCMSIQLLPSTKQSIVGFRVGLSNEGTVPSAWDILPCFHFFIFPNKDLEGYGWKNVFQIGNRN